MCDEDAPLTDPVAALKGCAGGAAGPSSSAGGRLRRGLSARCCFGARKRWFGFRWGRASCARTRAAVAALALVQAVKGRLDTRGG